MKKRKYCTPSVKTRSLGEVLMLITSPETPVSETPADPNGEVLSRERDSYVPTPSSVWDD